MSNKEKTNWSYDSVSSFYQKLAHIYSLGMIKKSKEIQLRHSMKKGKSILYVGVGSGEDAVMGAENGMNVTCIDISPKMLNNVKNVFRKKHLKGKFICCDVIKYNEFNKYDYVAVNYFLNNFSPKTMEKLLAHISKLIKPDGKLLIADFMIYSKNPVVRGLQKLNFMIAVSFFSLLGVASVHRPPNYISAFRKTGMTLESMEYCRLFGIGLPKYGSIVAVRNK